MELKITKEKVLEASKKCGTAKEVLTTLFPEVFSPASALDLGKLGMSPGSPLILPYEKWLEAGFQTTPIEIRIGGNYSRAGFYLNPSPIRGVSGKWKVVIDNDKAQVLIFE